jgi:hypothetical protein
VRQVAAAIMIDTQFGELPPMVWIADVVNGTSDKGKLTIRTRFEIETLEITAFGDTTFFIRVPIDPSDGAERREVA